MPYKDKDTRRAKHSEYMRERWYPQNKQKHIALQRAQKRAKVAWLADLKSQISCLQCGETHPAALDFHHNDPSDKETRLSTAVNNGWGRARLLAEMEKCTVLCANCHRKLHYEPRDRAE